ncbi:MAG: hypothetical protein KGV50_00535 [Gammaproteobacteria bacterium]|nr:hypothetical protein [Gammaproteobacteria bacterium]
MNKKKAIVAIWHTKDKGKTATLHAVANTLREAYPNLKSITSHNFQPNSNRDFRFIADINGIIVGIESKGDPGTKLKERLTDLVEKYKCDIIFCATRTSGKTVDAVEEISKEFDYDVIWTSTYQEGNNNQIKNNFEILNDLKSKHLIDLLKQLNFI